MMTNLETILASFGLHKVSIITGALGAMLAAAHGSDRSAWSRTLNFVGGFVCAAWGTGAVVQYFAIPGDSASVIGAMGFALGYFGMSLVDALQVAIAALRVLDWKEIVTSWLKRGGQ